VTSTTPGRRIAWRLCWRLIFFTILILSFYHQPLTILPFATEYLFFTRLHDTKDKYLSYHARCSLVRGREGREGRVGGRGRAKAGRHCLTAAFSGFLLAYAMFALSLLFSLILSDTRTFRRPCYFLTSWLQVPSLSICVPIEAGGTARRHGRTRPGQTRPVR
jgi:hypothetical protein